MAMDIKHSREKYGQATGCGCEGILPALEESLRILRTSAVPFEVRTTLVKGIHKLEDVEEIGRWIRGDAPWYLQNYVDSGHVLAPEGLGPFSESELKEMLKAAQRYCPAAALRT